MTATYGGKDIKAVVTKIMKVCMSDDLMSRYNRTGVRGKNQLPYWFNKSIYCKYRPI